MILKGEDISFSYPGETLFSEFSFGISEGESVVFRGESGSGKSTLFKLLLGFETPDSGHLTYHGKPLTGDHLKTFRQDTAWLPQDLNLGEGSVRSVMDYPFTFKSGHNHIPDHKTRMNVLGDLGLDSNLYEKEYRDLSTGQRQRVGIALCILLDKPVLLLDEPTSALDQLSKERAFRHLRSDANRTILSTSHDAWWVERCDRVIDLETA